MNKTMKDRRALVVSKELHQRLVALAEAEGRKMYWLANELLGEAIAARVVDGRLVADEREPQEGCNERE